MNCFTMIAKNKPCRICLMENAGISAVTAAEELGTYFQKMCGTYPDIVVGKAQKGDVFIALDEEKYGDEKLAIFLADGILHVEGGKRGVLYAVYELLECMGCGFFTEDCEVVPTLSAFSLSEDFRREFDPVFEHRSTSWVAVTAAIAPKLRINGTEVSEKYGGYIKYIRACHTLGELAEMEHDEAGGFTDWQPCLTNEKVFETVVKNARAWLDADPKASLISISQNDSYPSGRGCCCPACKALDEKEGTPMGSLLHFVNRVAKELHKTHPDVSVSTLSYRYTRRPPKTMVSENGVIIRLCSIECCYSHPMTECNRAIYDVDDDSFRNSLEKWTSHSDRIYIWDYTTNFTNYNATFANFGVLRKNIRFFADNHVRGLFEQGNMDTVTGEFAELRTYLLARLMWEPYMSEEEYQRHIDLFLSAYYGKGAPAIRRCFDRMQRAAALVHFGIYSANPLELLDPDCDGTELVRAESYLAKCRADFSEAKSVAAETEAVRLARAEIQLDIYQWHLMRKKLEAAVDKDSDQAELAAFGKMLYRKLIANGITHTFEGMTPGIEEPDYLEPPMTWHLPRA